MIGGTGNTIPASEESFWQFSPNIAFSRTYLNRMALYYFILQHNLEPTRSDPDYPLFYSNYKKTVRGTSNIESISPTKKRFPKRKPHLPLP